MTWMRAFLGRSLWAALILAGCLRAAGAAEPAILRINGSGACLELLEVLLEPYRKDHPAVRIDLGKPLGSSGAIKALLAGALDLAVVARPVTPEETAQGIQAQAYGRTPLALVTSRPSGPAGLTTADLAAILSGSVKTWSDGVPVRLVLRPEADTDTRLLQSLGPAVAEAVEAAHQRPGMIVGVTDSEANERVARAEGALGTSALCATLVRQGRLRTLALNQVRPTVEAMVQGTYPLAKEIYLVTTQATPAAGQDLLRFVTSRPGPGPGGKGRRPGLLIGRMASGPPGHPYAPRPTPCPSPRNRAWSS